MVKGNQTDTCRICGSSSLVTILSDLRARLGGIWSLKQCSICSFISVDPLPSAERLGEYYGQNYWQRYDGKVGVFLTFLYRLRISGIIKDMKELVPPKGRILDWGAGDGMLVKLLEKAGFEGYGIDTYSSASNQKNLVSATIEHAPFKEGSFDAVTCFHVFEHLYRPVSSMKKAFQLLKPGGILVVETPNIASIGFRVFKKKWYPLRVPVHLNHFSPEVMQRLFDTVGGSHVLKTAYFSHRHSPSSLVLSLIPAISPPRVRATYSGRFPLPLMMVYLFLQLVSYPFSILEALSRRGEFLRMYVQKKA